MLSLTGKCSQIVAQKAAKAVTRVAFYANKSLWRPKANEPIPPETLTEVYPRRVDQMWDPSMDLFEPTVYEEYEAAVRRKRRADHEHHHGHGHGHHGDHLDAHHAPLDVQNLTYSREAHAQLVNLLKEDHTVRALDFVDHHHHGVEAPEFMAHPAPTHEERMKNIYDFYNIDPKSKHRITALTYQDPVKLYYDQFDTYELEDHHHGYPPPGFYQINYSQSRRPAFWGPIGLLIQVWIPFLCAFGMPLYWFTWQQSKR